MRRPSPSWSGTALAALLLSASLGGCFDFFADPQTAAAEDFIRSEPYGELLIEIDYVSGTAPHADAVSLLKTRASERLDKPGGITHQSTAIDETRDVWSINDLKRAEDRNRNFDPAGNRMVLYVLYVDGHSDQDSDDARVLGVRYGATSVAIFKESIRDGSLLTGAFGVREVERSVLVHEFGHAIGLVNLGIDMVRPHEDADSRGHSSNDASVMWHAIETSDIFAFLSPPPNDFDCDDKRDVQAAGGKPPGQGC